MYFFSARGIDVGAITEVVFYIAFKIFEAFFGFILEDFAFEFAKNLAVSFVKDVGQHVQAAAVRHSHHKLIHAEAGTVLNHGIQGGHQALQSFQGEAFLADVFGVQEVLKHGGLVQFLEEVTFFVGIEVGDILGLLETTLQPLAAFGVADVAEFAADAFAIGLFEQGDNVFEFGRASTHFVTGVEGFL